MFVPLTPLDFLDRAEAYFGHRAGVIAASRRVTYQEFAADCRQMAGMLAARGVGQGDRVAWLGNNSYELLCAYYAVPLLGAILVPLNIRLTQDDLGWVLDDCLPRLLIHDAAFAPASSASQLCIDDAFHDEWAAAPRAPRAPISETDVAEIFYTSGSTGRPKGVTWTHRSLYLHAVHSALTTGFRPDDVFLTTIPLFHVNGWGVPHYATGLGARQVVMPFSADGVLDAIRDERITRLFLVPTMARSVLERQAERTVDVGSVRGISVGGAPVTQALLSELETAFDCLAVCGYGLTETSTLSRSHPLPGISATADTRRSIGLPIMGAQVRVVGPDGHEVARDATQPGEIQARSNHVTDGYWNDSAATDEAFVDGWFKTGDIATVDGRGYLHIVDRIKDLIISGGENISTVEIEAAINDHPDVVEAAVIGRPDPQWGETPEAWVEVQPGSLATANDLAAWLQGRLARFKQPTTIAVTNLLPKGGTGKVQKPTLRGWDPAEHAVDVWRRPG